MKKLVALLMAALMALSLAACGGDAQKDSTEDKTPPPAENSQAEPKSSGIKLGISNGY